MKFSFLWLCAITFVFAACGPSLQAQVITSAEIERGMSLSGPLTNGYLSFPERYSYATGPYLFLNGDPRRITYLDYLDRADRAQKFGYAMPVDPFFPEPVPTTTAPAPSRGWFSSGGFGILRRR